MYNIKNKMLLMLKAKYDSPDYTDAAFQSAEK